MKKRNVAALVTDGVMRDRAGVVTSALPVMRSMEGFAGYYLVAGDDDTIMAVSLFTNQATAQHSSATLMPWIPFRRRPYEALSKIRFRICSFWPFA